MRVVAPRRCSRLAARLIAGLAFTAIASAARADRVAASNLEGSYNPNTGGVASVGRTSPFGQNAAVAQRFTPTTGGFLTSLDLIVQEEAFAGDANEPLRLTIRAESGDRPGAVLGGIAVTPDRVPDRTSNAPGGPATPVPTRFDFTAAPLRLLSGVNYYAALATDTARSGSLNGVARYIVPLVGNAPADRLGAAPNTSPDGGQTWNLRSPTVTAEVGLAVRVDDTITRSVAPTFDVQATVQPRFGAPLPPTVTVRDGDAAITVQPSRVAVGDARGVLEFDAGAVPDGVVIDSASVTFDVVTFGESATGGGGGPGARFDLFAYAGNGTAEEADALQTGRAVASAVLITATGPLTVALDVATLQSLLAGPDARGFLGLVAVPVANTGFAFNATEAGTGLAPRLTLTLAAAPVPEPLAVLAGLLGVAAVGLRRARPDGSAPAATPTLP